MTNQEYLQSIGVTDEQTRLTCLEAMEKYGDNHWWEPDVDSRTLAYYQMQEPIQLVVPFSRFREAIGILLGRSVWTYEFGLNDQGLIAEAQRAWDSRYDAVNGTGDRQSRELAAIQSLLDYAERNEMPVIVIDTDTLSQKDRKILLDAFRQFRANHDENDGSNYSNRDALEKKLQHGGDLSDLDKHMLLVSVANEVPDQDVFDYFNLILG